MIRDYLTETRLLSQDIPDDSVQVFYAPMVYFCERILSSFLGGKRPAAEVIITYSAQRKCELVELGGKKILIYDKNLGQVLNTFNRILFFSKESIKAYRPIFNLLVDESIMKGLRDSAIFFFGKSNEYAETWDLPAAASRIDVWTQTHLQELFIFAHEYCHLIASNNTTFHSSRARVGKLLLEVDDELHKLADRQIQEELQKRYQKRYGEAPSLEELAENRAGVYHDLQSMKEELIDELGCDDFALHVLKAYCHNNRIASGEKYKAAFLALRHVRAINYVRAFVQQLSQGVEPFGFDKRVRLLQLRQHRLRSAFSMIFRLKLTAKNRVRIKAFQDEMSELSDLHDEKLDNVILFELLPNISEECEEWQKRHQKQLKEELPTIETIATLRGWYSRLSDAPFVSMSQLTRRELGSEESGRAHAEPDPELGDERTIPGSAHYDGFARARLQRGTTDSRSGVPAASIKVGRNDPCPCGSGKKFKRCCLG